MQTDNGSVAFDNVRIPHFNMLARFASVDIESGDFSKPKSQTLAYGTMSFVRFVIFPKAADSMGADPSRHRTPVTYAPCARRHCRRPLLRRSSTISGSRCAGSRRSGARGDAGPQL